MIEQERKKYGELSEEEKEIKRKYGRNRYKNISEENNQRLKNITKIIVKQKKYCNLKMHDSIYYLISYFNIYRSKYINIMDLIMYE